VTQDMSFAPNQLIKQGAKLVQAEPVEAEQRNLLVNEGLTDTEKKLYGLLNSEQAQPIDSLVETSGLNSSEVLATLFTLEIKGVVRQLPGKQLTKVLLRENLLQRKRVSSRTNRAMHPKRGAQHLGECGRDKKRCDTNIKDTDKSEVANRSVMLSER
jgi:hypothetical protein